MTQAAFMTDFIGRKVKMKHIILDQTILISVVLKATDQIVGAYLEDVEVRDVFQHGLNEYTYWGFWESGKYECRIQARTDKFTDDHDELSKLEWNIMNGTIIPKLFNRSWIEREI